MLPVRGDDDRTSHAELGLNVLRPTSIVINIFINCYVTVYRKDEKGKLVQKFEIHPLSTCLSCVDRKLLRVSMVLCCFVDSTEKAN